MAPRSPDGARRKLIEFDSERWQALELLARDRMSTIQELADEAFRDLLKKHQRPETFKAALKQSVRSFPANEVEERSEPAATKGAARGKNSRTRT